MVRRLVSLLAALGALLVLAIPVSADGATTFTQNFHGAFPPMTVGPLCGAPGGTLIGTGNAVFHITVNGAGDVWITTTQEESFTLTQTDPTLPTFTGHFAAWFGLSANRNSEVAHDIFNVTATGSDGSTLSLHLVDHISVSASGQVTAFSMGCGS